MFRSYCRLWLWLNPSVVWHFLFLSPVIAHFGHFLSLSFSGRGPPTPFHGTPSSLECVKSRRARENVSSIICAVSREGERALQTGLLLQVWDQRPRPHWSPPTLPLISSPLCSLMTLFFFFLPPRHPLPYLGSFWTPFQKNATLIALFIRCSYDQIPEEAKIPEQ